MIYRTTKMEDAVRELAKSHRLICVRTHHRVKERTIRFRANSIADLPVHFYRPSVDGDGALNRWQAAGGVLINPTPRVEGLPPHDVHLFSECPVSVTLMQAQSAQAAKVIVYQPPVWDHQVAAIERMFPPKETCKRVYEALRKLSKKPLDERYSEMLKFNLLARYNFLAVCTDAELAEYAEVPLMRVGYIRDLIIRYPVTPKSRVPSITGLTPRFPPDDPALMEVWRKIEDRPDNYRGERFFKRIEIPMLGKNITRTLSTLTRSGSITRHAEVYMYPLRHNEPDWWKINRENEYALANFKEIRAMVKKAKEI